MGLLMGAVGEWEECQRARSRSEREARASVRGGSMDRAMASGPGGPD